MKKQFSGLAFLILLTLLSGKIFTEESKSAEQELASNLLAAQSEEERSKLLESNKSAVTVELRKALIEKGQEFNLKSDFPHALTTFELAKLVSEKIGDDIGVAQALRGIGTVHILKGENEMALDHFQKSLAIAQKLADTSFESACLRSVGNAQYNIGNTDLALQYYEKSLHKAEEAGDKVQLGSALNNTGFVNMELGNYTIALEYLEKALSIYEEIGNKQLAASSLNNMAIIHDMQGNYQLALEYYRRSLKIGEELGDRKNVANILNNIGDFRLLGSYDAALEYNLKSLSISEELGDKPLAARASVNIANAYRAKGLYDQALNYSLKALKIAEDMNYKLIISDSQRMAANVYLLKSDYKKSLEFADRALTEARKIQNRQSIWKALEAKGKAHYLLNQSEFARKSFEEAIVLIEDWRLLAAGGEMERQGFFSEMVSPYHEMIQLLIAEGDSAGAFAYAERAKARVLLDVIQSGKINIAEEITPEEKKQEQKLYKELSLLNRQIQDERMNSESDQQNLVELDAKIQKARLEFESFQTKLYVLHPEVRVHRGEANPLQAEEAIELFTDSKTVFLEYVVTNEKTFLFVLESGKKIPNVYTISITQEALAERVKDFRIQMGNRDPKFLSTAKGLYELLVAPAIQHLKLRDKLVFVPDDVLWSLPFQAFQTKEQRFLIEDYAVCYVPSLTVLRESRKLHKNRKTVTQESLLALGNPTLGHQTIEKVKRVYRNEKLDPLPEAEKEVTALKRLYGMDHSKVYVGLEAREDRIKNEASKFDIIHLATHGIVNDAAPMYSQLILAQGMDAEEDGLLEAWEIMNLKLNADLVVLSACDT
ncbi:MAG TPA: CHAT domain-containing tetratricopeptide repeat protein, partial [Acidobacteriota bacterium]|nr:CHAT domain-containing tetratricopeptide repeat protein [Acidobacteriota bacterium]